MDRVPPTRSIHAPAKHAQSNLGLGRKLSDFIEEDRAPAASSNRPSRRCNAPVKEPFSWPNNSEAIKSRGIAAQLTQTKAREERRDADGSRAQPSSLPVPVSPVISTVASVEPP